MVRLLVELLSQRFAVALAQCLLQKPAGLLAGGALKPLGFQSRFTLRGDNEFNAFGSCSTSVYVNGQLDAAVGAAAVR